jgi:hypothetical protein
VEQAFKELFFRRTYSNVVDDGRNGLYRLRITYERTIGDADKMPEDEEETAESSEVEDTNSAVDDGNDNGGESGDDP